MKKLAMTALFATAAVCLIACFSFTRNASDGHSRLTQRLPGSPWFVHEGQPAGFRSHVEAASWSWLALAAGLACAVLYRPLARSPEEGSPPVE